jgi:exopolyphosphatase/guanosine-5'-triphosphate,3'-diphosphate pyrophosphatase
MSQTRSTCFAAIDVGTNAVRLKIARRRATGRLETLHQQRDPVRPGEGVFSTGAIGPAAAARLLYTLREYGELCREFGARTRAVATSALREASNRAEVVERARHEAGIDVEVISGREEARLICLGVLEGAAPAQRALCIDIGGGSTELAVAIGEAPAGLWSLPAGAVRLMEQFGGDPSLERMRAFAHDAAALLPASQAGGWLEALGCSGTARALVAFATGDARSYATCGELTAAGEALWRMGAAKRRKLFEPRRADVIVSGAVILTAVIERLQVSTVRAVKRGLRDGILLDLVRAHDAALLDAHHAHAATATHRS